MLFDPLYLNKVVPKLNMSLFNHFNLVDVTLACDDDDLIQAHKCLNIFSGVHHAKRGLRGHFVALNRMLRASNGPKKRKYAERGPPS